jgi:hypothetical protein
LIISEAGQRSSRTRHAYCSPTLPKTLAKVARASWEWSSESEFRVLACRDCGDHIELYAWVLLVWARVFLFNFSGVVSID